MTLKSKEWPKISIVTPTFNQGSFIEYTIQSILNQRYPNLEYIIIDGGSSDQTVDIIQKYSEHLTYWESVPDRGQAHAINKGIERATGDIFNWINSDDILADGALHLVAENWRLNCLVASNVTNFLDIDDSSTHFIIRNRDLHLMGHGLDSVKATFHQPGLWTDLNLVKKIYPLDESLRYSFDTSLFINYLAVCHSISYVDKTTVYFRVHNDSKSIKYRDEFFTEKARALVSLLASRFLSKRAKSLVAIASIQRIFIIFDQLSKDITSNKFSISRIAFRVLFLMWRLLVSITAQRPIHKP